MTTDDVSGFDVPQRPVDWDHRCLQYGCGAIPLGGYTVCEKHTPKGAHLDLLHRLAQAQDERDETRAERDAIKGRNWAEMVQRYARGPESDPVAGMVCTHDGEFVKRVDFLALTAERDHYRRLNEAEVNARVKAQEAILSAFRAVGIRAPCQPMDKAIGYFVERHQQMQQHADAADLHTAMLADQLAKIRDYCGEMQDRESGPSMHPAAKRLVDDALHILGLAGNAATDGEGK